MTVQRSLRLINRVLDNKVHMRGADVIRALSLTATHTRLQPFLSSRGITSISKSNKGKGSNATSQSKSIEAIEKKVGAKEEEEVLPPLNEDGVPGLRLQDFKALMSRPKDPTRKEYPIRWDWHVRIFLYALIPGCCLWIFTLFIDYFLMSDPEVQELFRDFRETDTEVRDMPKTVELIRRSLEQRVGHLEEEVNTLKDSVDMEQIMANPNSLTSKCDSEGMNRIEYAKKLAKSMCSSTSP